MACDDRGAQRAGGECGSSQTVTSKKARGKGPGEIRIDVEQESAGRRGGTRLLKEVWGEEGLIDSGQRSS